MIKHASLSGKPTSFTYNNILIIMLYHGHWCRELLKKLTGTQLQLRPPEPLDAWNLDILQ
jgi:hypothetical protein